MCFISFVVCLLQTLAPLRFCEFGRAAVARNLSQQARTVHYFAYVLNDFDTNSGDIRSKVYEHWDGNPDLSPPKNRGAREDNAQDQRGPSLALLAWANGAPIFPDALLSRFQEGTSEHSKMKELHEEFKTRFPVASQPQPASNTGGRAGGFCDFSADSGRAPLDPARQIDLPQIAVSNFSVVRPRFAKPGVAFCQFDLNVDRFSLWQESFLRHLGKEACHCD